MEKKEGKKKSFRDEMMCCEQDGHFDLSSYFHCKRVHFENKWNCSDFQQPCFPIWESETSRKRDTSPKIIANSTFNYILAVKKAQ